jgi:hypothetical protein
MQNATYFKPPSIQFLHLKVLESMIPKDQKKNIKCDKQDQQGKTAFIERNPYTTQWQEAKEDPKQKLFRAQGIAQTN